MIMLCIPTLNGGETSLQDIFSLFTTHVCSHVVAYRSSVEISVEAMKSYLHSCAQTRAITVLYRNSKNERNYNSPQV